MLKTALEFLKLYNTQFCSVEINVKICYIEQTIKNKREALKTSGLITSQKH